MTQNTYTPSDLSLYTQVETEAGSLTGPFNPDRVAELVNTAMVPFGGIPPVGYLGCGEFDTLINVALPNPVTQQQIDDCMTALLAICNDPTRNDPTEEQTENAALQARIDATIANIAAITGTGGLDDQLLTNVAWNALTADAQADVLRGLFRAGGGAIDYRDITLDLLRAVRYLLRQEKKRQTGVFLAK